MIHTIKSVMHRISQKRDFLKLPKTAQRVLKENLTYLSVAKMTSLKAQIERINTAKIEGDFVEFGVALGGSAVFIAEQGRGRSFTGYDVFDMIPPPSERDDEDTHKRYETIKSGASKGIGEDRYYGYEDDLYDKVVHTFARYGLTVDGDTIALKKGLFEDTVDYQADDKIALAHIDCDWFDPVTFCIESVSPVLSPGGIIILDDYNDYGGCQKAVDQALAADKSLKMMYAKPHAVIQKMG